MPKTFTAPFAQIPKTASAVATGAVASIAGDTPTNTVELLTAGAEGAIVTKLSAIPLSTVTASNLVVFISQDTGATKRLKLSALMEAHTVEATTAIPETLIGEVTEETPIRLQAGDVLYVGSQVALADGIVFNAEYTDY